MVLEELARLRLRSSEPTARGLIDKLERCQMVPPGTVVSDGVTLGSRVVFRGDASAAEARVLTGTATRSRKFGQARRRRVSRGAGRILELIVPAADVRRIASMLRRNAQQSC
jgi:hypothetical protein